VDEFEIRGLLAAAMVYDNRKPGDAAIMGWAEAASRGRWTYGEALNAIHAHYAESRDFIMPGDITQRIRARRHRPAPVRALLAEPDRVPADPARVAAMVAEIAAKFGWRTYAEPTTGDLDQACPHCDAGPGRPCARRISTGRRRGEYVPISGVHHSRKATQ
jgi:hypothetical protein